jgi:hypothetical protein
VVVILTSFDLDRVRASFGRERVLGVVGGEDSRWSGALGSLGALIWGNGAAEESARGSRSSGTSCLLNACIIERDNV